MSSVHEIGHRSDEDFIASLSVLNAFFNQFKILFIWLNYASRRLQLLNDNC